MMTRSTLFFVLANLLATSACVDTSAVDGDPDQWGEVEDDGQGPDAGTAEEPDLGTEPDDGTEPGDDTGLAAASDDPPAPLRTVTVASLSELRSALSNAKPGDLIKLRNKTWTFSGAVDIPRSGTADHPIVISAETTGGVTITGSGGFALSGVANVVVRGFNFRFTAGRIGINCSACSYVRFTRNRFELAGTVYSHWLRLAGASHHNRIDRNVFINKKTMGNMLNIDGTSTAVASYNVIERNYFANHSYPDYNNGECIRVGFSGLKYSRGYNIIQRNLFERCNGDPEVISNKSSDNTIRYNTFRDNNGALVFRHGHRSKALGNFFFNNNGGIRFYGDDHQIVNNYFEGNRGTGGARSTIVIGSGNALDDTATSTGNDAVERALVAFNTLVNNSSHIAIGASSSHAYGARDCTIANNLVIGSSGSFARELRAYSGFKWEGNMLSGSASIGEFPSGSYTRSSNVQLTSSGGIQRLTSSSPARDAAAGTYSTVLDDVDGHARSGKLDVGADEYSTATILRRPLRSTDVGPTSL